jgi:competence protein ComEA
VIALAVALSVASPEPVVPLLAPAPLVDINAASAADLESLPGIGAKKAQAIVQFRQRRPFRRVTELMRVKGIGPKLYQRVKGRVRCGSDPPT